MEWSKKERWENVEMAHRNSGYPSRVLPLSFKLNVSLGEWGMPAQARNRPSACEPATFIPSSSCFSRFAPWPAHVTPENRRLFWAIGGIHCLKLAAMGTHRQSNGLRTFLEHWGLLLPAVVALIASQVLAFFAQLTGRPWIWCYSIAVFAGVVAVGLLFYAKLPLYRQRQFFTFGSAALPESRRSFYRWGYRCLIFAVALLLCLLLSRP